MLNKTELTRQLGRVIFRLHQNKLNAEQGISNIEVEYFNTCLPVGRFSIPCSLFDIS